MQEILIISSILLILLLVFLTVILVLFFKIQNEFCKQMAEKTKQVEYYKKELLRRSIKEVEVETKNTLES